MDRLLWLTAPILARSRGCGLLLVVLWVLLLLLPRRLRLGTVKPATR